MAEIEDKEEVASAVAEMVEKVEEKESEEKTEEKEPVEEKPVKDGYDEKARDMGWVPEEEYPGDSDEWIGAKEFIKRAPLFRNIKEKKDHIKSLERKLGAQVENMREMAKHINDVDSIATERAIKELKKDYKDAVRDDDDDKASEIDKEMDKLREVRPAPEPKEEPPEQSPGFKDWVAKNDWYKNDEDMQFFADAYGQKLIKNGIIGDEMLEKVETKVKETYPNKFFNPRRKEPATVENVKGAGGGKKGYSRSDLTPEQKEVHDAFVDMGMKSEKYIKQCADRGLIKEK